MRRFNTDDKDANGWVRPGIGGSVYKNLNVESRTYCPYIVEHRMGEHLKWL